MAKLNSQILINIRQAAFEGRFRWQRERYRHRRKGGSRLARCPHVGKHGFGSLDNLSVFGLASSTAFRKLRARELDLILFCTRVPNVTRIIYLFQGKG